MDMKKAVAYSPAHITGFFIIHDEEDDPLKKGSRGVGVSIEEGVFTKVSIEKSSENRVFIRVNGRFTQANTSRYVVDWYLDKVDYKYIINVDHDIKPPIGAGFGTSGGGALSLSLALNKLFELDLTDTEAAQVAHIAEVTNKTGLGTVIAEFYGGFEVRIDPGAPGIGRIIKMRVGDDMRLVALNIGKIYTKNILSDKATKNLINRYGEIFIDKLVEDISLEKFLIFSRSFAKELNLASKEVFVMIEELSDIGVVGSMAMIGHTVFTIIDMDRVEEVLSIYRRFRRKGSSIIVSKINNEGARFIKFLE